MLNLCKKKNAITSITLFNYHIQMLVEVIKIQDISEKVSHLNRMKSLQQRTAVAYSINSGATDGQVLIPALALTPLVTLGKSLSLSVPQFPVNEEIKLEIVIVAPP